VVCHRVEELPGDEDGCFRDAELDRT